VGQENALVKYILNLNSHGFPPKPRYVREIANPLLAQDGDGKVGKTWASSFVKRREELRSMFTCKYDYRRALSEDPDIVKEWFDRVKDTLLEFGIDEDDICDFDETGFMMGIMTSYKAVTDARSKKCPKSIQPGNRQWATVIECIGAQGYVVPSFIIFATASHKDTWYDERPADWRIPTSTNGWTTNEIGLDWLRHFDRHTKGRTKERYRLLILDGHASHKSAEFLQYCNDNDIVPLCMPAHSSHTLRPLDTTCCSPLKRAYRDQIEACMKAQMNYVSKDSFLSGFKEAYKAAISEANIKSAFKSTGLVPFDPITVLNHLSIEPSTPPFFPSSPERMWASKTPRNMKELELESTLVKEKFVSIK
jgi:hypothetical protein